MLNMTGFFQFVALTARSQTRSGPTIRQTVAGTSENMSAPILQLLTSDVDGVTFLYFVHST